MPISFVVRSKTVRIKMESEQQWIMNTGWLESRKIWQYIVHSVGMPSSRNSRRTNVLPQEMDAYVAVIRRRPSRGHLWASPRTAWIKCIRRETTHALLYGTHSSLRDTKIGKFEKPAWTTSRSRGRLIALSSELPCSRHLLTKSAPDDVGPAFAKNQCLAVFNCQQLSHGETTI